MKSRSLFLPLIVALVLARTCAAEIEQAGRIRQLLHAKIAPNQPGAAVAIVRDGKTIFAEGFGLADLERQIPVEPQTIFDLASCSKQFTAMAVLILQERGKLRIDDPVRKYLPELPKLSNPRQLQIADLLQMTSGLPDYLKLMDHPESKTNLDVLKVVSKQPASLPGRKFEYSDTNYVLLAIIVERVAEMRFAEFLRTHVFEPSGMTHTVLLEHAGQKVMNRARGYRYGKTGFQLHEDDTGILGDGQVMTSVTDMAAWDRALRANQLVSSPTLSMAFTSGKLDDGTSTGYGMGWYIGKDHGHAVVRHGGGWAGTSTHILRACR